MNTHPPTGPAEPTDPTDRPGPEEEAYLDRLRAVDPASTAGAPDLDSLRAAVAARVAAGEQTGAGDDLAARRHARRGWPVRAAAAAAVVVVGSGAFVGGYALGHDAVVGAAPAISLSRPASGAAEGAAGLGPVDPQGADQGSVAEGLDAPEAGIGGWWGRVDFTSSGLSGEGGRGEGWAADVRWAAAFMGSRVAVGVASACNRR